SRLRHSASMGANRDPGSSPDRPAAGHTRGRADALESEVMSRSTLMHLLGIRAPLICAPMAGVAGGQLASAVSHAGGLGMIGMGSTGSAESLWQQLAHVATSTNVGIGMVDWVTRCHPDMLELALGASPALLSVCFGE